ncbi:Putative major facilitator superfamily, MFS transporter superfamily [Septoria linicola]|uniref:Major facilitator superfamily, MFS transporter superfamily n=1 Tax=Septoria linicola TaxID=215465 RepID=A0A9Q9EI49_9PEZI|nr:putative major facilitator superfamily, MFS transporter superfamily [Septoria linicola]USW49968.1 Putative major facilitator superfamily, MFS transporter superfamily [Septoria linicola]
MVSFEGKATSEQLEEKEISHVGVSYVADAQVEKRITRKLDLHILPWIFILWLLAFIDRSNIGNAKLDGLIDDLELTGNRYNVALTVFYILYVLVDIPSNILLKVVGGGRYLPLLAMAWGIVGTCMGAVKSYAGLIVCRMLLGACEGGMFGGIILYLSMFYKRHQLMFRLGVFYCAAPLSGAIGGLLATGLAQISYRSYRSWPWIFFVEGSITVLVAMVAFFFLPDTPSAAKFLSKEEQQTAANMLSHDLGGSTSARVEEEHFNWPEVRFALLNVNTVLMSLNFFLILIPIYSYSLFLPSIVKGLGYKNVTAQLFTVPPNFLAFLSVIAFAWTSDRIKMRGPLIGVGLSIATIGYIMQLASSENAVKYAGTFFVAIGAFPCSPLVLAWLSNNLAPHTTKATGLGFQVAIGNCGAFVATFTYLAEDGPEYTTGHAINLGAIGLSLLVTLGNIAYIRWENAARQSGKREYRLQGVDPSQLGYRHPDFRYTT